MKPPFFDLPPADWIDEIVRAARRQPLNARERQERDALYAVLLQVVKSLPGRWTVAKVKGAPPAVICSRDDGVTIDIGANAVKGRAFATLAECRPGRNGRLYRSFAADRAPVAIARHLLPWLPDYRGRAVKPVR